MVEETLEYLEKVLAGLRSRLASGDKSVEPKLRAVAARIDQVRLQNDMASSPRIPVAKKLAGLVRRRSCCR
jgi:hypothetical protein